jgi:hypothetical protein
MPQTLHQDLMHCKLQSIAAANTATAKLEDTLSKALEIAGNCAHAYLGEETTPAIRRRFNQGLFRRLYISQDGQVERFEMTQRKAVRHRARPELARRTS